MSEEALISSLKGSYRQILGIRFFIGSAAEAVQISLRGGLVVVPAAPALIEIKGDEAYRDALLKSDLALTDSGFMVLVWNMLALERIRRLSGLEYIKALVGHAEFRSSRILWVMPTPGAIQKSAEWLRPRDVIVREADYYLAPVYEGKRISDPVLLEIVQRKRPEHIVIALAGGVQEKLGHFIKQNTTHKPGIHCIGAAIGFLSGDQVNIPDWADRLFLGWFFRCVSQPAKFIPRYARAVRLLPMLIKYRQRLPG